MSTNDYIQAKEEYGRGKQAGKPDFSMETFSYSEHPELLF